MRESTDTESIGTGSVDVRPTDSGPVGAEFIGMECKVESVAQAAGRVPLLPPTSHPGEPEVDQEMCLCSPADGKEGEDQQGGANALLTRK